MRVTLTFNLPDEKSDLFWALQGFDWHMIVAELARLLRSKRKYEGKSEIKIEELENIIHEELRAAHLGGLGDLW